MVKMEEISGLETNIGSFQQIFGQYLPFSQPDISTGSINKKLLSHLMEFGR